MDNLLLILILLSPVVGIIFLWWLVWKIAKHKDWWFALLVIFIVLAVIYWWLLGWYKLLTLSGGEFNMVVDVPWKWWLFSPIWVSPIDYVLDAFGYMAIFWLTILAICLIPFHIHRLSKPNQTIFTPEKRTLYTLLSVVLIGLIILPYAHFGSWFFPSPYLSISHLDRYESRQLDIQNPARVDERNAKILYDESWYGWFEKSPVITRKGNAIYVDSQSIEWLDAWSFEIANSFKDYEDNSHDFHIVDALWTWNILYYSNGDIVVRLYRQWTTWSVLVEKKYWKNWWTIVADKQEPLLTAFLLGTSSQNAHKRVEIVQQKDGIYINDKKFAWVDAESFYVLNHGVSSSWLMIEFVDKAWLRYATYDGDSLDVKFLHSIPKGEVLLEVDVWIGKLYNPRPFKVIISKDASHVYFNGRKIHNVDPATFVIKSYDTRSWYHIIWFYMVFSDKNGEKLLQFSTALNAFYINTPYNSLYLGEVYYNKYTPLQWMQIPSSEDKAGRWILRTFKGGIVLPWFKVIWEKVFLDNQEISMADPATFEIFYVQWTINSADNWKQIIFRFSRDKNHVYFEHFPLLATMDYSIDPKTFAIKEFSFSNNIATTTFTDKKGTRELTYDGERLSLKEHTAKKTP